MGSYFDTITVARLRKAVCGDVWKDGQISKWASAESQNDVGIIQVIRLESYEDALANLVITRPSGAQASLIEEHPTVREDYYLRYLLHTESTGSPSMLNVQAFDHPFEYKLKVAANTVGETKEVNVDLVETFNWLLGLRVHTMDVIRGFHVVTGRLPGQGNSENGDKALIIWRDTTENPNEKLDEFFSKQAYNTQDQEFDVIYVNGDNNLQNLRKDDQTWKVRLIEEEFHRLMWDVEDV
jgi:adenine-specific DNA-methyltransferase